MALSKNRNMMVSLLLLFLDFDLNIYLHEKKMFGVHNMYLLMKLINIKQRFVANKKES